MSTAVVLDEGGSKPNPNSPEVLRVGLLGCGTVGSPVAKALLEDGRVLEQAAGARLELVRVVACDPHKARPVRLPPESVTTDALAVAIDPEIDIVIEVMGGTDPAFECILGALGDNKAVVTANKGLLAGPGTALLDDSGADLYFEAAVCGAIPIVRTLREYCAADHVESFTGLLSGTCNFVLSEMTQRRCSFDEAVAKAQGLGYAEADPTADVEGFDAAAKVALLARVAFGLPASIADVEREGISHIDSAAIDNAAAEGFIYKLVGHASRAGGSFEAWVGPALVPLDDPLAHVTGVNNAVSIETERAGQLRLQGQGAGGLPTAAAVLGDLVTAARSRLRGCLSTPCRASGSERPIRFGCEQKVNLPSVVRRG